MFANHGVERHPGARQKSVDEVVDGFSQQKRPTVHV